MSNLVEHAKRELEIAGYDISEKGCNPDNPKDPMDGYMNSCAKNALELVEVFSKAGHSGMSAGITLSIFNKLANWKNLTSITNNPEEWSAIGDKDNTYQNKRNPSCFTTNFKTYHDVSEDENYDITIEDGIKGRTRKDKPWIEHPLKDYKEGK